MYHSTIAESIIDILRSKDETLDELEAKFRHSYDFNERSALISSISILILENVLSKEEQIIGLWFIFREYSKSPISSSPYFILFKTLIIPILKKQLSKGKTGASAAASASATQENKPASTLGKSATIAKSTASKDEKDKKKGDKSSNTFNVLSQDVKTLFDEYLATLASLMLLNSPTLTQIGKKKPNEINEKLKEDDINNITEKYMKRAVSPIAAVEEIMRITPAVHHYIFLEILFFKLLNMSSQAIIAKLKEEKPRTLDFPQPSYFRIIRFLELATFLKGDLQYVYAAMLSFFKFDDEMLNQLPDEAYAPIIFIKYLKDSSEPNTQKTTQPAIQTLRNFNIFGIMSQWVDIIKSRFSKTFFSIIAIHIQNILFHVLECQSERKKEFLNINILPILIKVAVKERPMPFSESNFAQLLIPHKDRRGTFIEDLFPYFASVCKNSTVATIIKKILNGNDMSGATKSMTSRSTRRSKISFFINFLDESELSLAKSTIGERSAEYSSFLLLHRLIKYSNDQDKKSLIYLITNRYKLEHSSASEMQLFYIIISQYLWIPAFAPFAAKIISNTIGISPKETIEFFETQLQSKFTDFIKIIESTNNDDRIILAFITISKIMNKLYFKYRSPIKEIPRFSKLILQESFPRIVHRKFQSKYQKWKILRKLVTATEDLLYFDPEFCTMIHTNESFISALITLINTGASAISTTSVPNKAEQIYADRVDTIYPLKCEIATLRFIKIILTRYLENSNDVSPLCKIFFNAKSDASAIFSTLIGFFESHYATAKSEELASTALEVIELLCTIAARMKDVSVDAYYSESKQAGLNDMAYQNLIENNSTEQKYISLLDFIASTLMSQPAFAFSFIQHIAKSFYKAVISNKLLADSKSRPRLLLSLSRLIAHMFRKLSANSKTLTEIAGNQISSEFWTQAFSLLTDRANKDPNFILAQSYLMQAHICYICSHPSEGHAELKKASLNDVINSLIERIPPINIQVNEKLEIDLNRFRNDIHEYGNDFYIDTNLFKFYHPTADKAFIGKLVEYNQILSRIDAITQYISTVVDYIRLHATIVNNENKCPKPEDIPFVKPSELIPLLSHVFSQHYPESLVNTVCRLFLSISANHNESGENLLLIDFVKSVANYVEWRRTPLVFDVFSRALRRTSNFPNNDDVFKQLNRIFDVCIHAMIEDKIEAAGESLVGISYYLRNDRNSIDISRGILLCSAADSLCSNEILGPMFINALTCFVTVDTDFDESEEIVNINANKFVSINIIDRICNTKLERHSKLWPALFSFLATLPPENEVAMRFVVTSLQYMVFFLTDTSSSYTLQAALTSLIYRIRGSYKQIANENPAAFNALMRTCFDRMKHALNAIKNPGDEEKDEQLETLTNCLLIFNCQFELPVSEVVAFSDNKDNKKQSLELMRLIMDYMHKKMDDDKQSKEFDEMKKWLIIFESAARLFVGLSLMSLAQNESTNEGATESFRELADKVAKTIREYQYANKLTETTAFLDKAMKLFDKTNQA